MFLLTEEGAKAARTEGGFQVKKARGWEREGARQAKEKGVDGVCRLVWPGRSWKWRQLEGEQEADPGLSLSGGLAGTGAPGFSGKAFCILWPPNPAGLVKKLGFHSSFYICNRLLLATRGKKSSSSYTLIITSVYVMLLHEHLFVAGVKLYFFVSVLLLLLKPGGIALPWQIQAFCRDFCSLPVQKHSQPLG